MARQTMDCACTETRVGERAEPAVMRFRFKMFRWIRWHRLITRSSPMLRLSGNMTAGKQWGDGRDVGSEIFSRL